mgnify:FL=1
MILDRINSPSDLKKLNRQEIDVLASEIRSFLINSVADTGGHLASNLGAVELTLALHTVFDCPKDKFIWDVGHQAYVHKIITGRKDKFDTLRKFGGLSGFPKGAESDCDAFDTGHSSTSVSAALGLCHARDLKHENYDVIAVIGDGSMTGGEAYEALNNAGNTKVIVVLNDNNMSIAKNVGNLSKYLSRLTNREGYYKLKNRVESRLNRSDAGKVFYRALRYVKNKLRNLFFSGMFFTELGFKYYGPIDGHDFDKLTLALNQAKQKNRPCLIHVCTKKGKGYKFAEEFPAKFHGVSGFDVNTGSCVGGKKTYSSVFGETLTEMAQKNDKICAVTAAMPDGTGLLEFANRFPERFFDVGIAEEHAVTFSAGLAKGGMMPYFAVYSTFLQRGYDQIIHDAALTNLHVCFCIDRAGLVGADGETHQGLFDLNYMKSVPNMTVMAPSDFAELKKMLLFSEKIGGPVSVRYPRGGEEMKFPDTPLELGRGRVLKDGSDCVIFAIGKMTAKAVRTAEILEKSGVSAAVCDMRFLKPFDDELVRRMNRKIVVSVEDGCIFGGLSEEIERVLCKKIIVKAFPDEFISHGDDDTLFKKYRLDEASIAEDVLNFEGKA